MNTLNNIRAIEEVKVDLMEWIEELGSFWSTRTREAYEVATWLGHHTELSNAQIAYLTKEYDTTFVDLLKNIDELLVVLNARALKENIANF